MADNSDDLIISVSTDVATLKRSNKRLEAAMGDTLKKIEQLTAGTGQKMDASFAKAGNSMAASLRKAETASRQVNRAGLDATVVFAKFFALLGTAKGFQDLVDSSTRMTNSLKVAGLQGAELQGTLDKLYASALKNHAPIESLTTLYGRAAMQQKELGASSQQLVTFTDTVGKALRVSGTSATEAEGSLLQLSQALGSGTVHAEEFNSILEGMPALAQAAAKGIKQANGSVAELKNLVINGQISSRALFDGIIAGASDLDSKLQGSSTTIGQAFTDLHTALTKAASDFDHAAGAGKAAVEVIEGAAKELNELDFVKFAGKIQAVIDKLDEWGKKYNDLFNASGNAGDAVHDFIMGTAHSINGGKPLVDLGAPLSNQSISEQQKNSDAERLKALQDQLDAANELQKAIGTPVNNQANIEILRQMDEIRDKITAAKDAIVSFHAEAEKRGPDILQGVQRLPSFKDMPAPPEQVDLDKPQYSASAANATKLKKSYDDLVTSAKNRNEQLQQEIGLVGKSGAVLDAARVKLQLLQKAQEAGITGDQLKSIEALADAYGKLAEKLAGAQMVQAGEDRNTELQQEIDLVGKTGVAYDVAKYKLELLQEAKKNGVTGDALKAVEAEADAYGRLADTLSRVKLAQDLNDQNRLSSLSDRDRQIVQMQRQYGQPEDPNSDTGKAIGESIDRQANREAVTGFLTDFKDGLVKNGESIGKAFATALENSLMKQADKLWDQAFKLIGNALFPGSGTGATGGAGGAGGLVGVGGAAFGKLLSPSSLNNSPAAPTSQSGVAAQAWNFFASKGLQPHQIAGVLGNIGAESSFNPSSIGDAGQAFGLFQYHADRGGGQSLLASGATGQLEHAWTELQGPENKAFQALMKSTDVRGATAAFAGFERPRGFSLANPEGADNFSGRLSAANDALSKFGNTTTQATQGVGALGSGLGQLGTSLGGAAAAPAAPGGGGLFGWLGGLFGGSSGSQWNLAAAGKLKPGLFADGGYTGPGGKNTPAGIVHAGEFVIPKHIVDKIGVPALSGMIKGYANGGLVTPRLVSAPTAPALAPRYGASAANNNGPGILHVQISGASGDDHVRTLVKQGVGEGLSTYNTQQRRGGFGTLQGRYANQKG